MNIEQLREHCLKKKAVTEEFPFDAHKLYEPFGYKELKYPKKLMERLL